MTINEGMFTSKTGVWATPQDFFDKLDAVHGFTVDVCANADNAKCSAYFTEEDDGLAQSWEGVVWCNPPYGRGIGAWVKKGWQAAEVGAAKVVMLLPARTDTQWWHDFVMKGQIEFIKGRLKFGGSKDSAPFPSAVVVFERKEPLA